MSFLKFQASELSKRIGRGLVSSIAELSGRSDATFDRLSGVPSWTILGYHRIIDSDAADPFDFGMCTSVANFERQLYFLKQTFRIETVQSALDIIKSQPQIDKPILSITFDDGYLDNHTLALPILSNAGLSASFYICTADLDTGDPFWWDRVIYSLAHTRESELSLKQLGLDAVVPSVSLASYKRRHSLSIVLQALWSTDYRNCMDLVAWIEEVLNAKSDREWAPRMSSVEIRALLDAGMELGCHNSVHHDMTLMETQDVITQLERSASEIRAITGERPAGFAYPAGVHSNQTRKCVSDANYAYALGTERGLNPRDFDHLNLKRMSVGNNSISDFKRCLAGLANTHLHAYAQQNSAAHVAG